MSLVSVLNKIIRYSFYLLFILVPLILTPWNYELFEFNKMLLTYALTTIIVTAWMIKIAVLRSVYIRRTPLDVPILLFLLSQLVSALFSIDPHVSWFGYYSRFNGGMLSVITYVLLFYAFISNIGESTDEPHQPAITKTSVTTLLMAALVSGLVVSLYGILQRGGIDKDLWVQDVQNRVFSTLGQPNWLAAYLAALLPIPLAFALRSRTSTAKLFIKPTVMWFIVATIFFVTLLFTKSRSGFLGASAAVGIFTVGAIFLSQKKGAVLNILAVPLIIFLLLSSVIGTSINRIDQFISLQQIQQRFSQQKNQTATPATEQPTGGSLMEFGGTESGTIRQYVWQAAITAWRSTQKTFFIGTGTETFAFAFFQHRPVGHNLTSEWDFLYNKAHNEYLNYLATTGILGLITYGMFLFVTAVWFLSKLKKQHTQQTQTTFDSLLLPLGLFSGWVSLLVTNFFGFSVVITQIMLFLYPAIILLLLQKESRAHSIAFRHLPIGMSAGFGFTGLLLGAICLAYVSIYWFSDRFYAIGYRESRQGLLAQSYRSLTQAILLRPTEPNYYDELSVVLSGISVAAMEAGSATQASELARESLAASDKALSISPKNVNFWKSRTKIYFGFASVNKDFVEAAIEALEKALELSPLDPKITYNLAVLHGQIGQNEQSIELLKQTILMKPNYRDAYYALYVFYLEVKQENLARATLEEYLTKVNPNDADFKERLSSPAPATLP